jgi:hypothetical protein
MSSSKPDSTVRYAEYFEEAHTAILNNNGSDFPVASVVAAFNSAYGRSPFGSATVIDVTGGFFSYGYSIASFPCLWDMFGKFMAGLDVHDLWGQTFNGIVASAEINQAVSAQSDYLDDDLRQRTLPRFEGGMRNINAVQSSAFAIGRALIENNKVKAVNKFASEIRLRALDVSIEMWAKHLDWNTTVVGTYAKMYQLYYSVEMDANNQNVDMRMRDVLFDLSLFEYVRSMLGVVSGAMGTVQPQGPSQTAKAVSGALGGAAMGYQMTGNPYGALIGGVVGLAASFIN